MKNRKIITAVLSLAMAFAVNTQMQPDRAGATTVDDVIAYARSVGMPEEQVQQCINTYSGRDYTSEQCDKAIAMLSTMDFNRDNAIAGGSTETGSGSSENKPAPEPPTAEEKEKFEGMDVHEKKDYVNSLPQEEKKQYLDLMTNEEKNQLVKEMNPSEQVGIISGMLGMGEALGYQLAVENVADGSVMLSARDESGKLVGVQVLGDSVEKTGKPYTVPIAVCGSLIALSAAGMYVLVRKCRED